MAQLEGGQDLTYRRYKSKQAHIESFTGSERGTLSQCAARTGIWVETQSEEAGVALPKHGLLLCEASQRSEQREPAPFSRWQHDRLSRSGHVATALPPQGLCPA